MGRQEVSALIVYDKPVTNAQLIEWLQTQSPDEKAWINGCGTNICIGHNIIYSPHWDAAEYEFLYTKDDLDD